jgi:hypothetical protein
MTTYNPNDLAVESQHLRNFHEIVAKLSAKHMIGTAFVVTTQVAKGPPNDQDAKIVGDAYALGVSSMPGSD